MASDKIPNILLEWNTDGRRRTGRPSEQWLDEARRIMNSKKEDVEDREQKRRKIVLG